MRIPNWLVQVISVFVAVLLVFLTLNQIYTFTDKARNIDDKHIVTISAEGKVTAVPDLATVIASVVTNADTAKNAQDQNTQKMNKVIDYVKSQGVDSKDIQTSSYNINPSYDYSNPSQPNKIIGYEADQTITIKVHNLNLIGTMLDGLTQNGVNQVQNISYGFNDPDSIREQAREQALGNAKDKAQKLASAAGVQLGKLISFTEDSSSVPIPIYGGGFSALAGKGGAVPAGLPVQTEPGSQDITANVTVTYSLK